MAVAWRDDVLEGHRVWPRIAAVGRAGLGKHAGVAAVILPVRCRRSSDELPGWIAELIDSCTVMPRASRLISFEVPLALEHLTPFGRHVVAACRRIPWGQTRTYGDLAAECGSPAQPARSAA